MDEIVVSMSPLPSPVEVIVEPALPDISVTVEPPAEVRVNVESPPPPVQVNVWQTGLPGRDGADGVDGRDGVDGNDGGATAVALEAHVVSETPHPVYDEGVSLALLYENAKV